MRQLLVLALALMSAAPCCGVALASEPVVTVLKPFRGGAGGGAPYDALLPDSAGNLYGVAYNGGVRNPNCLDFNNQVLGCGVVYKLTPPISGKGYWTETVLHSFTGRDGYAPDSPLIFDGAGNLYGTTETSGPMGGGTVFKLAPPAGGIGSWTLTTLHAFGAAGDGFLTSYGGVIIDSKGALYGTTMHGGPATTACVAGCGTAFKLTPPSGNQKAWTETILYAFKGAPDGAVPASGVSFGPLGYVYGTASLGGTSLACSMGCGTAFALIPPAPGTTAWTENTLVEFNGVNGAFPARLVLQNGSFYSTTEKGGKHCLADGGCGTVFQLIPPTAGGTAWSFNQLLQFNGDDGEYPQGPVTFDSNGNLYGSTFVGGNTACPAPFLMFPVGCGTVFELTPPSTGTEPWTGSVIYRFSNGAGGANPAAGVGLYVPGTLTVTTTTGGQPSERTGGFGTALTVHPHMTLVGGALP